MLKLYMVPGTTADWRMYLPQQEQFAVTVPEWLPPAHPKEPLADYAERLAATLDTSAPFVLGGVSLGGMLAQEMALHCKPERLILIATCRDSKAVWPGQRWFGAIVRRLPDRALMALQWLTGWGWYWLKRHPKCYRRPLMEMIRSIPLPLLRWQIYAASHWQLSAEPAMPAYRLHGKQDWVISCRRSGADTIIRGGHLINITHADTVNEFIAKALRD